MLSWLSTSIFKHCAKRVSCFQYCLEFISYFLCKRALTCMSIPYLGALQAPNQRRRKMFRSSYPLPLTFLLYWTTLCWWPQFCWTGVFVTRYPECLGANPTPQSLIDDTVVTVVLWDMQCHTSVKDTIVEGFSEMLEFSALYDCIEQW